MTTGTSGNISPPLKEAPTNTSRGSKVQVEVEHPPLLFLRPETGEVIAVPPNECNALNTEIGQWNSLVATLHDANSQIQFFEEELASLACTPDLRIPGSLEDARRNLDCAIAWQSEVLDASRAKISSLSKLGSSGKQLVELIPLPVVNLNKPKPKPGELKDLQYTKEYQRSWGKGTKRLPSRDWIRAPKGSLVYVPSEHIKDHWPTFKDLSSTKWADVIAKGPDGMRKIHPDKLKQYANEAIKKNTKLQSKDFLKLEIDAEGALGAWAIAWNSSKSGTVSGTDKPPSGSVDIQLDAAAQLMRYLYGASLNATFEPFKGNVSFRAEGHAELAIAEAKASAELYLPSSQGWMWTLPAGFADDKASPKDIDLGAVRVMASLVLKGSAGASIAAEISLGIETIEGRMPVAKGIATPSSSVRLAKTVQLTKEPESEVEKVRVAGLDVGLTAFVGARADAELKGAIEWRNPESPKKSFEAFASIAPGIAALAGAGGTAKLSVQYVKGIFKIHADAGLCLGAGAQGKLTFEVSVALLGKFVRWFFYQLYHANYKKLTYLHASAFEAARDLAFLAIAQGEDVVNMFGMVRTQLSRELDIITNDFTNAEARQKLAQRILSDPLALRYAVPETKGMLIYQLCNDGDANWAKSGLGIGDDYLRDQKNAIKHILIRWSHTRSDCNNVIQHMTERGSKGDFDANFARLRRFLGQEAPHNRDLPGIDSQHRHEFDKWYIELLAALKDEPTRGFPVVPGDSLQYAMQRDQDSDHPLFSSEGERALYA